MHFIDYFYAKPTLIFIRINPKQNCAKIKQKIIRDNYNNSCMYIRNSTEGKFDGVIIIIIIVWCSSWLGALQ